ncbi:MAG: TlpA family protein disulfide reductase [Bryobacteraceae bacterium]|mgnify:FL=1|nr:TlpA family protein disulfide reductase [Bryobacteraceae bacterium]
MASGTSRRTLEAGDEAPEIRLPDLNGEERTLSDFAPTGRTLVAFFKTTCPTCQLTFPFLDRMRGGRLAIIGISQDDRARTREFNEHFGVHFPVLLDSETSGYPVSNAFGLTHVPSLYVLEPNGRIAWSSFGWSRKDIEALAQMAGVEVFRPGEFVPEWKAG